MAKLFISHSSRNNDKAIKVLDWLADNGWDKDDVFLDLDPKRGIVAGQSWKDALQKAAFRCEVVLALVSAEWLASGWCKSEIDAARLMGKKIIVCARARQEPGAARSDRRAVYRSFRRSAGRSAGLFPPQGGVETRRPRPVEL